MVEKHEMTAEEITKIDNDYSELLEAAESELPSLAKQFSANEAAVKESLSSNTRLANAETFIEIFAKHEKKIGKMYDKALSERYHEVIKNVSLAGKDVNEIRSLEEYKEIAGIDSTPDFYKKYTSEALYDKCDKIALLKAGVDLAGKLKKLLLSKKEELNSNKHTSTKNFNRGLNALANELTNEFAKKPERRSASFSVSKNNSSDKLLKPLEFVKGLVSKLEGAGFKSSTGELAVKFPTEKEAKEFAKDVSHLAFRNQSASFKADPDNKIKVQIIDGKRKIEGCEVTVPAHLKNFVKDTVEKAQIAADDKQYGFLKNIALRVGKNIEPKNDAINLG